MTSRYRRGQPVDEELLDQLDARERELWAPLQDRIVSHRTSFNSERIISDTPYGQQVTERVSVQVTTEIKESTPKPEPRTDSQEDQLINLKDHWVKTAVIVALALISVGSAWYLVFTVASQKFHIVQVHPIAAGSFLTAIVSAISWITYKRR